MAKLETLIYSEQHLFDSQSEIPNPKDMLFRSALMNEINKIKEANLDITDYSVNEFKIPDFYISSNEKYLKNYSVSYQSWLGHVIKIKSESFIAELNDLTNSGTKEIAEFDFEDISPNDKPLIELGAAFYWNIGKKMNKGQISNESIIRFQRLVDWDVEEYDNATDRANELFNNLIID